MGPTAMNVAWVAAGGAAGSVARYLLATGVQRAAGGLFPWGTLAVNAIGSVAIGFLSVRLEVVGMSPQHRIGVLVGILGGFTTFSAFSLETMRLIEGGQTAAAVKNILGSIAVGLIGCAIGLRMARGMSA